MRFSSSFSAIRFALLGTVAILPATAFAQAAVEPADQDSIEASSGNEIVVTAQKIEQRAKDVPITISALSSGSKTWA